MDRHNLGLPRLRLDIADLLSERAQCYFDQRRFLSRHRWAHIRSESAKVQLLDIHAEVSAVRRSLLH